MRSITPDALRALFAEETDEVFVFAVKLTHPDWADSLRVVRDTAEMYYNGELYLPYPFDVHLPEQSDNSVPTVTLTVDNIDRLFVDEIRLTVDSPEAEVYLFRRSFDGTDTKEIGPMQLKLTNIKYNARSFSGDLSLDADYLNEQATKDRFLPSNSPGLFS